MSTNILATNRIGNRRTQGDRPKRLAIAGVAGAAVIGGAIGVLAARRKTRREVPDVIRRAVGFAAAARTAVQKPRARSRLPQIATEVLAAALIVFAKVVARRLAERTLRARET
jgi:hypothetical protein